MTKKDEKYIGGRVPLSTAIRLSKFCKKHGRIKASVIAEAIELVCDIDDGTMSVLHRETRAGD